MSPAANATSTVVMVRPSNLAYNEDAADSNAFMNRPDQSRSEVRSLAVAEWEALVALLRSKHVTVHAFEDAPEPFTPDACFPNNWISSHTDGTVVLYPMQPPSRRLECREDIIGCVSGPAPRLVDLRAHADAGEFLEGTGSLVLDRASGTAYAALSARTHRGLAEKWAAQLGYTLVCFRAFDARGGEIYHTNVMMSVGKGFALACLDAVHDAAEREALSASLRARHELVPFSLSQLDRFVGNCLELEGSDGPVLFLSSSADAALEPDQRARLSKHATLASTPMGTIESIGGGSLRCCLLEVVAARRDAPYPVGQI